MGPTSAEYWHVNRLTETTMAPKGPDPLFTEIGGLVEQDPFILVP